MLEGHNVSYTHVRRFEYRLLNADFICIHQHASLDILLRRGFLSNGSVQLALCASVSAQAIHQGTMVENRKKHRQNSHPIIHCPTSEGVSEVSERANE